MFIVSGFTFIPAFNDEMRVDFTSYTQRSMAEDWIEDNDWTGISFFIRESN